MPVKVTLNFQALDRKADRAARGTTEAIGRQTQDLMQARMWGWPGLTERRNGALAGTRRDLVDTGALLRSQSDPQRAAAGHYRLSWNAEYAAAVFLGAVFRKRRYSMPARNAPLMAVRRLNIPQVFAQEYRRA